MPDLIPYNVPLRLLVIVFVTWANLRGARESAALLAAPTYSFVAAMAIMVGVGLWQLAWGHIAPQPVHVRLEVVVDLRLISDQIRVGLSLHQREGGGDVQGGLSLPAGRRRLAGESGS